MINFRCNVRKALNAILWVANKRPGITRHTTVKIIYYADKGHLLAYGRPITGDSYTAMPYGPVPSVTYNLIKNDDPILLEALELDALPLTLIGRELHANESACLDEFSPSEIECLEQSFQENANLSFNALVDKTHKEPEYRNASHWMKFEDFFDGVEGQDEIIEDLDMSSRSMVI